MNVDAVVRIQDKVYPGLQVRGNPDQEMFDVIQRCVNYILPPVTPSLIQS